MGALSPCFFPFNFFYTCLFPQNAKAAQIAAVLKLRRVVNYESAESQIIVQLLYVKVQTKFSLAFSSPSSARLSSAFQAARLQYRLNFHFKSYYFTLSNFRNLIASLTPKIEETHFCK